MDTLRKSFQNRYVKKCLDAYEDFFMKCYDSEHNYTLYYYDEAGNLVKTVPPQGVDRIADSPSTLSQIASDRKNNTQTVFTSHTYASTYKYNSLNQLLTQNTPDNNDFISRKIDNYPGVPSTENVQSAAFNGYNGVLLSNNGTQGFLYTFDSYLNTWVPNTAISNVPGIQLNDVVSVGTSTYYAIGQKGTVLTTTNNGSSWTPGAFPNTTANLLKAFVITGTPEIDVYDQDGNKWTSSSNLTSWALSSNFFSFTTGEKLVDVDIDNSTGVLYAISSLNKTYYFDGISTWSNPPIKSSPLTKVTGDGGSTSFAVGKDGTLLKSVDHGATWNEVLSPLNSDLADASFYGTNSGFILTQSGKIMQTTDGGITLTDLSLLTGAPSNIQAMATDLFTGYLYAISTSGSFYKYDYGTPATSWNSLLSSSFRNL